MVFGYITSRIWVSVTSRHVLRQVDIVVGTPGRLCDLLDDGSLRLDQVQTVVLDEVRVRVRVRVRVQTVVLDEVRMGRV